MPPQKISDHLGKPTTAFIGISIVMLVLIYAVTILLDPSGILSFRKKLNPPLTDVQIVRHNDWTEYRTNYQLSFKYDPAWNVDINYDYDPQVVLVTRGEGKDKLTLMRVFISQTGFLGTEGLPLKDGTVNGYPAKMLEDSLVAITHGGMFYTFDSGYDSSNGNEFRDMLSTINFQE